MVTGILNMIAIKFYLYWTTNYFDILMHFLGGLWVTLTVLWLWSLKKGFVIPSKQKVLKVSIIFTLIVGVMWEIYELYIGVTLLSDGINYWTDTSSDLMMDFVGAVFGSLYGYRFLKK